MYLEHYRLREPPFALTPDTGFFFSHASHQEALNVLLVALRSGEGFIKIVGEVGTGKTLLCRMLLNTLGPDFVTCYVPDPLLTPSALRLAVAEELGIRCARNIGQHGLLKRIHERLIGLADEGKQVVLCLDEAQSLPDDSLESLRLLTNLETEKFKLLQVVLFGQPELDRRLARPALRQLRQRITFAHSLQPLDRAGAEGYVRHRLQIAGHQGPALFTPRALAKLHRSSGGYPRLLNILCHKALLAAYGTGAAAVGTPHVRRAIQDSVHPGTRSWFPISERIVRAAGLALALTAGIGLYVWRGAVP
ncbi:MAG: ExeA family protein [Gammaproteobacteria bacterium]